MKKSGTNAEFMQRSRHPNRLLKRHLYKLSRPPKQWFRKPSRRQKNRGFRNRPCKRRRKMIRPYIKLFRPWLAPFTALRLRMPILM